MPIRCSRGGPEGRHITQNAYYIRRPGPAREDPQTAQITLKAPEFDVLVKFLDHPEDQTS